MPPTEVGLAPPAQTEDTLGSIPGVGPAGVTLNEITRSVYHALRSRPANRRVKMTYLDGTLILMSPESVRERAVFRLSLIVWEAAAALRIDIDPVGMTTLRRDGRGPKVGAGKEPDNGFYLGETERLVRGKEEVDLSVDPPPDLALEVDDKADSALALATYARIGVPEVWRFWPRRRKLWFGRLAGSGYAEVDRSGCLPNLTPPLVLEALAARTEGISLLTWREWVQGWARALPAGPGD